MIDELMVVVGDEYDTAEVCPPSRVKDVRCCCQRRESSIRAEGGGGVLMREGRDGEGCMKSERGGGNQGPYWYGNPETWSNNKQRGDDKISRVGL